MGNAIGQERCSMYLSHEWVTRLATSKQDCFPWFSYINGDNSFSIFVIIISSAGYFFQKVIILLFFPETSDIYAVPYAVIRIRLALNSPFGTI
jgi:hypothetical protein